MRNTTVDGCDYTVRLDEAGDGWEVVSASGDLVADFTVSNVCEGVEYTYHLSDGDTVNGINTEMYYDDWMPERIAAWLISTHPEN